MSSENLNNLSIEELKKLVKEKNEVVEKLKQENKKEKLIQVYKKLQKKEEKLRQLKPKSKLKLKLKSKTKRKRKRKQKSKTFIDYFQECIKNRSIPKDTPPYFKKALERAMKEYNNEIKLEKSALKNFAEKYVIDGKTGLTPLQFFAEKVPRIKDFLRNHRKIKVKMILICEMEKQIIEKTKRKTKIITEEDIVYLVSKTYINYKSTDVKVILSQMLKEIMETLANYQRNGSGWNFKEVNSLEIHTVDYKRVKGSGYIPLPDFIMRKKAIINMEDTDEKCFLWSLLRYLHPVQKHSSRINDLREYENDLNFKGIDFPVKLKDITKFENQNPDLPGINVFSVNDNNKIYSLKNNEKDPIKSIDLFLFSKGEKQHYSQIKNFSRLVRSQITSDTTRKLHICKKGLTHFTKQDFLEKHLFYCENETAAVIMPRKNTILNFKNHLKKLPIPFVIYADFECFTKPINSCQPNPNKSYTQGYQKHEPSGYCLLLKGLDGINVNFKPIVYTKKTEDEDISKKFITHVRLLTHMIYRKYYSNSKPYNLTPQEEKDIQSATICHICEQDLNIDEETGQILKVRDHCHFTGEYRGAAHNQCNLKCKKPLILPVLFHNLQGYDSHLFIKQLANVSGELSCIPSTEEKYILFSKKIKVGENLSRKMGKPFPINFEIRFIDSFKFLQTSLANLVSNLQPSDFKNLNRVIKHNTSLLTRKGVYPYDYVSSIDKIKETKTSIKR